MALLTGSVGVFHRDSTTLPPEYIRQFQIQYTDPPYREHVHANATSQSRGRGTRKRDLGFESLSRKARRYVAWWASLVSRWSIVYSDVEDPALLRWAVQARGVEYVRTMAWVRWSMPQLSGDRPAQGHEDVLLFHPKGPKRWTGPGNLTHLDHLALRGEDKHKCEKPLDQALDLVSWFTDPGEMVFDGFAGHGTIALACRLLGRGCAGFDTDPSWAAKAHQRATGPLQDRDVERIVRWLNRDREPVSALSEGPSVERAQRRALDKDLIRRGVYV